MRTDIDRLMKLNHLDALVVLGAAEHNPTMVYLTGNAHISQAELIIKAGCTPEIFVGSMEREEAAKSGYKVRTYSNYLMSDFLKESNGDKLLAGALRLKKMFSDAGVEKGKVALYGKVEIGEKFTLYNKLQKIAPEIEFISLIPDPIFMPARMTKDASELDRIRHMGKVTTAVVGRVADFLTSHKVKNEILMKSDDTPLTIGDVKRKIDLWLAEGGAENPEGTIFASGRDSAIPHSVGTAEAALHLGQTIIFDIYPCEPGGGYFYDFTRTWCLGYAPDNALALYEQVKKVYNTLADELMINTWFADYQKRTCELFGAMGHPTIETNPTTEDGYVHSLGHGVGLNVHEMPFSGSGAVQEDILAPGSVFTLEPGLYYPDKGIAVRLEDTYCTHADGTFEVLAPYPYDLILPMKVQA
jgi:Xaa-Pro aminopeptidase